MSIAVKNNGNWRTVVNGGLRVRNNGNWRVVENGWVKNNGNWRKFYTRTDPVTVSFYPNWSRSFMQNGGRAWGSILAGVNDDDLIQGYWDTSQGTVPGPSGNWDHVTAGFYFNIQSNLDVRPVIVAASLRMGLKVGYGGTPLDSRLVLGAFTSSTSAPSTLAHTDTAKGLQETTATVWTGEGQVKSVALNGAMIDQLQNQGRHGIALHDTSHGTSETRKRETRTVWYAYNAATNLRPMLTVTFDYV